MAVKSVTVTQDAGASFIRINFNAPTAPGAAAANATYPANVKFPDLTFLREVSYRTSDNRHANFVVQGMRALKRNVSQRETEKKERASLVRQERLVLSHGRVHRLVGLWMLPTFGGRGGRKAAPSRRTPTVCSTSAPRQTNRWTSSTATSSSPSSSR